MDTRIAEIQKLLDAADGNLSSARTIMRELTTTSAEPLDIDKKLDEVNAPTDEGKVVEGVFDGEQMVAPDGQTYPVPSNYASKSKLVEGDTLKLTIANDGSFVFKQIAPVERRSAIGTLAQSDGNYTISAEGKSYKVLTASVTFYKAEPGDQVTITLPKDHEAVWASLENVVKKATEPTPAEPSTTPVIPSGTEESLSSIAEGSLQQGRDDNEAVPETAEVPVEPVTDTEAPEIEFPGGSSTVSDEQLLENLKNNLNHIDQPAYTPPHESAPKPVDNIVANDLAHINQPPDDKPIAELDI